MRRGGWALGLLAACLAWPAAAGAASGAGLVLSPCWLKDMESQGQCGVLKRPLDPAQPNGAQIDLHVAVLPSVARNKRPDPVFLLAGGPGQSAIDLAAPMARLLARLNNRRDIVLVDQRGTGRSSPLKCAMPEPTAALAEATMANQLQGLRRCHEALAAQPPAGRLGLFTTHIAMADLDAVRQALGAAQINLLGASYGTRAGLEYMRQFPAQVRRLVLDGVAPPDMVLPQAFSVDNQAALERLLAACEASAACARRYPALRAQWAQVLGSLPREVLAQHPLTGEPQRFTLERDMLLGLVRGPLYAPPLAAGLPAAIHMAAQGRFEPLLGLAGALGGRKGDMGLAHGMHFSVVCAEDAPRLKADAAQGRDFGEGFGRLYQEVCSFWPRGTVPASFYDIPPAPAATLLLSGGADPATPPRHGQRVAQALGAMARHVVVNEAGHGVMSLPCMRDVLFRFFDAEDDASALAVEAQCAAKVPRPPVFGVRQGDAAP
jgi:pimeloyl-ACP methyl ester carboxylesterase